MSQTANNLASYIWSLADLLRGDFKQSQYGRIILPFTLLRRLECVLEDRKEDVLAEYEKLKAQNLPEEVMHRFLAKTAGDISFYNTSKMDLGKLGEADIKDNLESYIQCFSPHGREIFEYFNFSEFIGKLNDANLLYKIVQRIKATDLSPKAISNHEMGLVFEELIRRFAEGSNETAGEHFTPRDIVRLTTSLVFMEDDEALTGDGVIRTIYDPTAGTGGFLSSGMEYVYELNPKAVMKAFGQELNPESYAICKADMMIKAQDVTNIKLGNTLSQDQLAAMKFDYMLSNPPFGVDWKKIEQAVKDEHNLKGFDGRFGPGLPRVSDGSLLFLLHLICKMRDTSEGGARIGIILNGSPLFTGGAGSGESEIRRYVLEADLLEAIVALPTDMFYNTGISTYVWVLSNKKSSERKGKIQLINGVDLYRKMRKSLGSKRKEVGEDDITMISRCYGDFEQVDNKELDKPAEKKSNRGRQSENAKTEAPKTFACKIFNYYEFGYRRITIERPLRESWQFSDERIENLRFASGPLNEAMKWVYAEYGNTWSDDPECELYGHLTEYETEIRAYVKATFAQLKEKQIKDLLAEKTWTYQRDILLKARELQQAIGADQHDDMNLYDKTIKDTGVKLDAKEKKLITTAISWKNPDAEKVIKKIHTKLPKGIPPASDRHSRAGGYPSVRSDLMINAHRHSRAGGNPSYGFFDVDKKIIEYKPDSDLRDYENVSLDPSRPVNEVNEEYFAKEVLPHVPEAWIDASKKDAKDNEIGIVGYEIPFNRHFYVYKPPRPLEEIDAELDAVSAEIMELLREVHS